MIEPLLGSVKAETKDNAYAALSRMIMSNEECTPNAEAVTMAICDNAPFKGDLQENSTENVDRHHLEALLRGLGNALLRKRGVVGVQEKTACGC